MHPTHDVTQVPGKVLRGGLRESWTCPNPGWIQFCDAVEVDSNGLVIKIGGAPLDLKVTVKKSYLTQLSSRMILFRKSTELDHSLISTQIMALPACTSISRLTENI